MKILLKPITILLVMLLSPASAWAGVGVGPCREKERYAPTIWSEQSLTPHLLGERLPTLPWVQKLRARWCRTLNAHALAAHDPFFMDLPRHHPTVGKYRPAPEKPRINKADTDRILSWMASENPHEKEAEAVLRGFINWRESHPRSHFGHYLEARAGAGSPAEAAPPQLDFALMQRIQHRLERVGASPERIDSLLSVVNELARGQTLHHIWANTDYSLEERRWIMQQFVLARTPQEDLSSLLAPFLAYMGKSQWEQKPWPKGHIPLAEAARRLGIHQQLIARRLWAYVRAFAEKEGVDRAAAEWGIPEEYIRQSKYLNVKSRIRPDRMAVSGEKLFYYIHHSSLKVIHDQFFPPAPDQSLLRIVPDEEVRQFELEVLARARAARENHMTQAQVQERTGWPRGNISKLENGVLIPRMKKLRVYARAIGAFLPALFDPSLPVIGDDPPGPQIADNLRRLLKLRGFTEGSFSLAMGFNRDYILGVLKRVSADNFGFSLLYPIQQNLGATWRAVFYLHLENTPGSPRSQLLQPSA